MQAHQANPKILLIKMFLFISRHVFNVMNTRENRLCYKLLLK
jgi:hypothetical protein